MTRFLLIRHGENEFVGHTIVGWAPGVHLNARGREQARRLADALAGEGVSAIYSSPLERAIETAEPLAARCGLIIKRRDSLGEIRVGNDWTGRTIADLDANEPLWKLFNSFRSSVRAPGGEMMLETQARVVGEIQRIAEEHPDRTVAVVSHGDPVRAAVVHYLGMPLDYFHRIEIGTASVTRLELFDWGARIVLLNGTY